MRYITWYCTQGKTHLMDWEKKEGRAVSATRFLKLIKIA